jgi:hypothetical protein
MKRLLVLIVMLSLAVPTLALEGCQRKVRVQTGTRYVCTYGEALGGDVHEVEVPASDAYKYAVNTKTITCSRHQQAENLYLKAQQLIKKGDLKGAAAALASVVKLDPKFRLAAAQLKEAKAGKKPPLDPAPTANNSGGNNNSGNNSGGNNSGNNGGNNNSGNNNGNNNGNNSGGDTNAPGMDAYRDIVRDIAGFTGEKVSAESMYLTRAYVPAKKGDYDQLVIMVQQYQDGKAAARALTTDIKSAYPASWATDNNVASLQGGFGTNGQGFAALSLVNGSVLVTFELHATGTKAASLRGELERIAGLQLD